jgi:hypothetical protein
VTTAGQTIEFLNPLLGVVAANELSYEVANQPLKALGKSDRLFAAARKRFLRGHAGLHRLIIPELERTRFRLRRGESRLYGCDSSAAELCVSIA